MRCQCALQEEGSGFFVGIQTNNVATADLHRKARLSQQEPHMRVSTEVVREPQCSRYTPAPHIHAPLQQIVDIKLALQHRLRDVMTQNHKMALDSSTRIHLPGIGRSCVCLRQSCRPGRRASATWTNRRRRRDRDRIQERRDGRGLRSAQTTEGNVCVEGAPTRR